MDATSWICAQVAKAEAEAFLGLPAVDLFASEAAAGQVKARLEALSQKNAALDYCLQFCAEASSTVKYRLFDTRILPFAEAMEAEK